MGAVKLPISSFIFHLLHLQEKRGIKSVPTNNLMGELNLLEIPQALILITVNSRLGFSGVGEAPL